jgi:hypothetical protein
MKTGNFIQQRCHCIRVGAIMLLAVFVTSCESAREYSLTYKLWDKGNRASCRPAPDARLGVFASESPPDVLVTYDALSEREDRISRRAYFLGANESRIATRQRPVFVEPGLATNLMAVPIVATSNAVPKTGLSAQYPVNTDSGPGFEMFRDGRSEGAHEFPIYDEGLGSATRVALTPLAVTGDTIMVGVVTGVVATVMWVAAGCPPFTNTY